MCLAQQRQAGIYVCCSLFLVLATVDTKQGCEEFVLVQDCTGEKEPNASQSECLLSNLRRTQHPQMTPSTGPRPRGPDRPLSRISTVNGSSKKNTNKKSRQG